ncbi:TetR/AcrR family transcriptional regulator [Chelativorans sp. YIM 93263]|uniref:TetR/AcrR family transcriptional regulator n=1 Tax=Chelativorans sp. YIM 93263 TaxID=2906648 RepID=UPI00237851F0|nr:TetR/AcrR family transcriptional regulator [Chelativorans sp. YIM 93263]
MRVSKEKAAENRAALLRAASELFRQRGIDGVGVAEVAKAAGLTHGALYAHFASKDALVAEAFSYGFERNLEGTRASAPDERRSFEDHLTDLFSIRARDNLTGGCPMTASASEIGRQGEDVSARFASAFERVANALEESLEDQIPQPERRRLAIATVAAQIGAIVVSRAVAKANNSLSDEVLRSTRATISEAGKIGPRRS